MTQPGTSDKTTALDELFCRMRESLKQREVTFFNFRTHVNRHHKGTSLGTRTRSASSRHSREISILVVGASVKACVPLLARAGFIANPCPDANSALRKLGHRYQVVLFRLDDSGMNGMKFLNLVRKGFPEVAVVVVTKPRDLRRTMLAMVSGASGYVQTPLRPEIFSASLRSAVKRKSLESALSRSA
jgi:PleD family two-component response regulator